MILKLRIIQGLSRKIVSDRELRTAYKTNRVIKYYGFYCALKSITTSGLIQDYPSQLEYICEVTKRSKSSFYTYIKECIELGLIQKNGADLRLSSWNMVMERFGIRDKVFTEFEYDTEKKEQTPEYYLVSAEIGENQHYQAKNVAKEILHNPQIKDLLNEKKIGTQTVARLQRLQVQTFVNGTGGSERIYNIIHSLNADVQRSVPKLRRAFNFKSNMSVGYMKAQLKKRGFAEVSGRLLKSSQRMRKNRNQYHTGWDDVTKESTWQLPDAIILTV